MIKYIVIFALTAVVTFFIQQEVQAIKYSDYKDVLSALLNISSIIFAIIGAWIAIIYPKAIGRTFANNENKNEFKDSDNDANYLSELVEIVLVSAIVLMFVLAIQFSFPVVKGASYFGLKVFYLKLLGFFLVAFLTIVQLHAIFRVILANYFFLNELRKKNVDAKIDNLHK